MQFTLTDNMHYRSEKNGGVLKKGRLFNYWVEVLLNC
jgi:hypothetical protein